MPQILAYISGDHDLRLVAIAILLCSFSCWTTITLLPGICGSAGRPRQLWTAAAALVFGTGAWATQIVAMLAFQNAFPVRYAFGWTIGSIAIAIMLSAAGFCLLARPKLAGFAGALVGLGVGAMHYAGMQALRSDFLLAWDPQYVLASILAGALFGDAAMLAFRKTEGPRGRIIAAALLTLSICTMHVIGMGAMVLVPGPGMAFRGGTIASDTLVAAAAATVVLIVALGLVCARWGRRPTFARSNEAARQATYIAALKAAKRDLNLAQNEASAANEAKAVFLAAMSHEMRTPLNAILGFAELMQGKLFGPVGDARYVECIDDIHLSGTHLLSSINRVLDRTQLDVDKTYLSEGAVSSQQATGETCRPLKLLAPKAA